MIDKKVIVVTGGAGLLGRSFIDSIAKAGWQAIIADINGGSAKVIVDSYIEDNNIAIPDFVELDINDVDSVIDSITKIHSKYGRIDAIVNNAYPRNDNYGKHFFDVQYSDFCENINLNIGGYFLCIQKYAAFFQKQGFGNIINIGSIYGLIAPKFEVYNGTNMTMAVEYSVIKSSLMHLTKYVAKYLKGSNIRVNALCPGGILDNQPDIFLDKYKDECLNKGMLEPKDINGTLVFLLSDESKYINGQILTVDDGFTL